MLTALIKSNIEKDNVYTSMSDIQKWIEDINNNLVVNIKQSKLSNSVFWFYDNSQSIITNKNNSFFSIKGLKSTDNNIVREQPIIVQNEIGYLGIICKDINGVLFFLMQGKIEPGNINKTQISPTIQATKSNFTQKHGGNKPAYLDYFVNAKKHTIIVDQIQSEQSSRFYKKRNRNIIIQVAEEVEVLPSHKWMTLYQIKELMKIDNLVNMDTRTVLSCIPYSLMSNDDKEIERMFRDKALYNSMFNNNNYIPLIFNYINSYKMFSNIQDEIVPLMQLSNWDIRDEGIRCKDEYSFSIIYCDIEMEGREIRKWFQPLFKAEGIATFGLFTTVQNGIRKFLVRCTQEIGCFDMIEIGPTIQQEAVGGHSSDEISDFFMKCYKEKQHKIIKDVILSEEGGRFYHEQNKNIIIEVGYFDSLPACYFWLDYKTLNILTQVNNCLNIQLRSLLSLLEI